MVFYAHLWAKCVKINAVSRPSYVKNMLKIAVFGAKLLEIPRFGVFFEQNKCNFMTYVRQKNAVFVGYLLDLVDNCLFFP